MRLLRRRRTPLPRPPLPRHRLFPDSVLRAKDQEITTLKDQITQLNAELERIMVERNGLATLSRPCPALKTSITLRETAPALARTVH